MRDQGIRMHTKVKTAPDVMFFTILILFIVAIVLWIAYALCQPVQNKITALNAAHKQRTAEKFASLHCKRSHYVGAQSDPVLIYKCDDGERTLKSIVDETRDHK